MELLNMLQTQCIELLGRYGYLTASQFQLLTGKSGGYVREILGNLSRRGYVRSFRIAVSHAVHSENMYVNTPLAVEFLTSHKNIVAADIKTTTTQVVVKDFFHRFNTINVNIAIDRHLESLGIPVTLMLSYFDKQGLPKKGTLTARTKIPLDGQTSLIPDSVFKTDSSLYLIEMYCDKDTKRIIASLGAHAKAIALGSPAKVFDIPVNAKILAVFSHEGILQAVLKRLDSNPQFAPMKKLFFFASLEQVKTDCASAFKDIDNNPLIFS